MRLLVVKTSSMGDILHTLPAITDASRAIEDLQIDWLVEEAFTEIPAWHPAVNEVLTVAWRRIRKGGPKAFFSKEWRSFKKDLKRREYDAIIDAQGLIKSARLTRLPKGPKYGLDKHSARESLSSKVYDHKICVSKEQHAVTRVRELFAKALGYDVDLSRKGDYGIRERLATKTRTDKWSEKPYLVFLHGTTWETKHYPEEYWRELIKQAATEGYDVHLLHGNDEERARAERLGRQYRHVVVQPKLTLKAIASLLCQAKAAIAVDTGLGHLAAAVDCPTVSVFGPTNPSLTGAYGQSQKHLASNFSCSPCLEKSCPVLAGTRLPDNLTKERLAGIRVTPPCFSTLKPDLVWLNLKLLL